MMTNKIIPAPSAKNNTFTIDLPGISFSPKTLKLRHFNAVVTFTSDGQGETLAIGDPTTGDQMSVPFAEIERLIEHTRRAREGRA